jgi:periplasmic protein CpxP/Spy
MKARIILVVALIVSGLLTANAQQLKPTQQKATQPKVQQQNVQKAPMTPVEMAKRQTERMTKELKLNEKQKTEVSAINLKYAKLRKEISEANKADKKVLQTKMKEMNVQKKAELKKVLTADQFAQLEKVEQNRVKVQNPKMVKKQGAGSQQPAQKAK